SRTNWGFLAFLAAIKKGPASKSNLADRGRPRQTEREAMAANGKTPSSVRFFGFSETSRRTARTVPQSPADLTNTSRSSFAISSAPRGRHGERVTYGRSRL